MQDKVSPHRIFLFLFFFVFNVCHCHSVCWDAVQLLAAHLCRLTESVSVFVTAQSLCPSAKTRDTAANNSFHNGSIPIKCNNGPNIYRYIYIIIIISLFLKVRANPILVFVCILMRRWQGRGISRRLSISYDTPFTPGKESGYLLCCFTHRLGDKLQAKCACCTLGNFQHSMFETKRDKWLKPIHSANGFKRSFRETSLWLSKFANDFQQQISPLLTAATHTGTEIASKHSVSKGIL